MSERPHLRAIFFDFDGVLVDSNSIKTQAFRILFADYGKGVVDEIVAYHQLHGGISRIEKIRYAYQQILKKQLSDKTLDVLAGDYSNLVMEKVVGGDWIPGAREFLDNGLGGLVSFVISGTPEVELKKIILRREMTDYFNEIFGSPVKKPTHIRNLLKDYLLKPESCLFIGDALTDYQAAQETGLSFIGIQGEIDFPIGTRVLADCRGLQQVISEIFSG